MDIDFWRKILRAVERAVGAAVLVGIDWLLHKLLSVLLPAWPAAEKFSSIIATAVFLIVYFVLLGGILTTFVPLPIGIGATQSNRGTSDEERRAR